MSNPTEPESSSSPYSLTESALAKRRNQPHYGRLSTQIYSGILACLSSFSFGTTLGWAHPLTTNIVVHDEVETKKVIWLVCIVLLGCSLGLTSCTFMMRQMGPKKVLRRVGVLYILVWWLMLIQSIEVQLPFRFFLGFFGISYAICGENLLMHTVHFGIRRYILVVHNSTIVIGVLAVQVVGSAVSKFWLTIFCACVPVLHYLLIQIVPESPVALYATSTVAAAKSLKWYRGEGNFYMDMANIKKDWDASRQDSDAYRYMLMNKVVYRPLLIIIVVTFFQVCTGYYIFMFYSMQIWGEGKIVFNPTLDSTVIGSCFVLSRLFWLSMHSVYSWNVRGILIFSCLMSAVGLTFLAVYMLLEDMEVQHIAHFYWTPFPILAAFLFFYDMGLNYYPKTLTFEYMPLQMYKRAHFIVQALFWLFAFLNNFTFAQTFVFVPDYISIGVLATITYVGAVFCYFFVVEPRGKSLVEIQLQFGGNPIGRRGTLFNQTRETV